MEAAQKILSVSLPAVTTQQIQQNATHASVDTTWPSTPIVYRVYATPVQTAIA